jgi:hypothetical protein
MCKDAYVGNIRFASMKNVQQDELAAENCEERSGVTCVDLPQIGTPLTTLVSHLQD